MAYDRSIETIIAPPAETLEQWEHIRQRLADAHHLDPITGSHAMVRMILAQRQQRFLNMGAFSRVYALNERRVLKFCRDLPSLRIMARLGKQSRLFPWVDRVLVAQAVEGPTLYHAAVVERLQEGYPKWIASVIDVYRGRYRVDTPLFARRRLLEIRHRILNGTIAVPHTEVAELAKAMRLLAEECANENCLADLRTEQNVMLRHGRRAVIVDPTYPVDLD